MDADLVGLDTSKVMVLVAELLVGFGVLGLLGPALKTGALLPAPLGLAEAVLGNRELSVVLDRLGFLVGAQKMGVLLLDQVG